METDPSPSEKFVENVVLFSITEQEPAAYHMGSEHGVVFGQGDSLQLKLFQSLIFWQRRSLVKLGVSKAASIRLRLGVAPDHG